jgi:hypothetical protein
VKGFPDHFDRYSEREATILDQFRKEGFVRAEDLTFLLLRPRILRRGLIDCLGNVEITVFEKHMIVGGEPANPLVDRIKYSYNVSVAGRGNVFRYNSPHGDHPEGDPRREHHVHRFDPFAPEPADTETVEVISEEADRPGLGDVLREAADWYYDHAGELGA